MLSTTTIMTSIVEGISNRTFSAEAAIVQMML